MSHPITPAAFVAKWKRSKLSERAASQEHFIDLCRLLGQPTPAEHDATGAEYTFEKGITITPGIANLPIGRSTGAEHGFADVWWNGKFGWEYKRKGKYKTLEEAYAQLQRYREALNNPPLLIVSDIARIEIHTNFTNTANETHDITFDDILDGPGIDKLRRVFTRPESFRPAKTTEQVTLAVATDIGQIAQRLQNAGHDPHAVAHFLMKCMFCLFAEKVPGLLPERLFKKLLDRNNREPERFTKLARDLFKTMATGGDFGSDPIPWFNGGLFDDAPPIELSTDDLGVLSIAANQDWAHIEPSILGTLFERSLDPNKRAQIGAHYTSKEDILLVIDPVIMQPLRAEWSKLKHSIEEQLASLVVPTPSSAFSGNANLPIGISPSTTKTSRSGKTTTAISPLTNIHQQLSQFLANLSSLKILDPACGSGNFLYVAIQQLLSLEKEIITFAAQPPISLQLLPRIRPTQLLGIEINPYAAELAQVSIWIGFLQWLHLNGFPVATDTPILSQLKSIDNRDAILTCGTGVPPVSFAAQWPDAHFIVGNPPFLGGNVIRQGLGDENVDALFNAYDIPKFSDLCCYWFELARRKIEQSRAIGVPPMSSPQSPPSPTARANVRPKPKQPPSSAHDPQSPHIAPGLPGTTPPTEINLSLFPELSLPRIGLLATQAIRGGVNRTVLERMKEVGNIFYAWSDRDWILDGAMVHVSIVGFDLRKEKVAMLDGFEVPEIYSDLSSGIDLTVAMQLEENEHLQCEGDKKGGHFELNYSEARKLLTLPNPNGKSTFDVCRPWSNGQKLYDRPLGMWILDFGLQKSQEVAAQYEAAFSLVSERVGNKYSREAIERAILRVTNGDESPEAIALSKLKARKFWWLHERPRPELRMILEKLRRFIFTTATAKHRIFIWIATPLLPDHSGFAFARDDDYFFGVLHSLVHHSWSIRQNTQLREKESGDRYTPTSSFETFPLPWPPGKEPTKHPTYTRIAAASKELTDLRERWLNPPELLEPLARILDAQDDFSDVPPEARPLLRHSALMAEAAKSPNLKKRTLTNLYNERPTWLKLAHEKLDRAVLAAYAHIDPEGHWQEDWATLYTETGAGQPLPKDHPKSAERSATDQKILTNLLRLNHQRANPA